MLGVYSQHHTISFKAAENAGKDPFSKPPPAKKEEAKIVEQPQAKSKSIVKGNRRMLQNPGSSTSADKDIFWYFFYIFLN
jgi:hypothetical protein